MDKSSSIELVAAGPSEDDRAPAARRHSRRHWLGATLGAAASAVAAEAASLAGSWDHQHESPLLTAAPSSPAFPRPPAPRLTHIGHSCHLIEMGGQRWLTDPWFFDPAFGSLRHTAAQSVRSIGPLDGIFISHRHADHFDPSALRALCKSAQVWTADPSLLEPLSELGFSEVHLSHPWLTSVSGALRVGFAPAVHDVPQHSLVLVSDEARVLFCADTGPHTHWSEIRRRFRPSTALLPCDGTTLRWEPRQIMNADEAARATIDLGCRQLLQTHGDARYSDLVAEHLLSASDREPLRALRAALARRATGSWLHEAPQQRPLPEFTPLSIGETRALLTS